MKIQALKSFTYMIPEPQPEPPAETVYWINQEVTLTQAGDVYTGTLPPSYAALGMFFAQETVDVIFNGDTYENVPVSPSYIGEMDGPETPVFTTYPFLLTLGDSITLVSNAGGTAAIAVIAADPVKVVLTVANHEDSVAPCPITYFGVNEDNAISDTAAEAIAAGSSAELETYLISVDGGLVLGVCTYDGLIAGSDPVNCALVNNVLAATAASVTEASITLKLTEGEPIT